MRSAYKVILSAVIVAVSLHSSMAAAFPGKKKKPAPIIKKEAPPTPSDGVDRSGAYDMFLQAVLNERAGDYPAAIKLYRKAARSDNTSSQALRRAAGLYLIVGDIKSALKTAKKCVKINPESTECLDILAGINTSLDKTGNAVKYLQEKIRISPEDISSIVALAVVYLKADSPIKAIEILEKAPPSSSHRFVYDKYFLGRSYIANGDYEKAVEKFELLFTSRPDLSIAFENLGWTYRMVGQWDEAIDLYQKYLAINSTDLNIQVALERALSEQESGKPVAQLRDTILRDLPEEINYRFFLGMTKWQQGEMTRNMSLIQEALAQFQLVRAAEPDNQTVISYIASIFESLNLLNEAVSAWKQIRASTDNEKKSINLKIADLYDRLGKYDMSLKHAQIAGKLDPNDPELKFLAGFMHGKLKQYANSINMFKAALDMNPNNPKYYFHLGVTYEKIKKYDLCIEAMKKVIALNPNHSNALNYLGYIYAEQDINLDEAEKYLLLALELEPDNGYFIDSLGWVYYKKKMFNEALDQLLTAVRNITPDPTVLEHLGDVYYALDRVEEAAQTYQRSLDAKVYDDRILDRDVTRKKLDSSNKLLKKKSKN